MKNIFIFIPDTLKLDRIGLLEGFSKLLNDNLTFYVTSDTLLDISSKNIGYCSEYTPEFSYIGTKNDAAWIHINNKTGIVTVNGLQNDIDVEDKVTCITYDFNVFKKSNYNDFRFLNYGEHFEMLAKILQENYALESNVNNNRSISLCRHLVLLLLNLLLFIVNVVSKVSENLKVILWYSATAVHLNATADTLKWALTELKRESKITLTVGNAIAAKMTDFLCGLILLYLIYQYEEDFISFVQNTTESIIQGLEHLLDFLMGSPVGLKLNFLFNKTLGNFFLYHISLWRAFLQASRPLLKLSLHLLVVPGAFGLSFQAALVSDLVAFSTFHVYCIYVYAARLYGVQIRSLISLWRLFIGRKYNPLRERVDSYQYTHHQLFIGTLGFTVLFFLLPTTFLYYAVFTVFRIFLIIVDGALIRLRYVLNCLPLYVGVLWLTNSPNVRGAIKLSIETKHSIKIFTVYATLQTLSFWQSIINSLPNTIANVPSVSWSLLFRSVATGLLL